MFETKGSEESTSSPTKPQVHTIVKMKSELIQHSVIPEHTIEEMSAEAFKEETKL